MNQSTDFRPWYFRKSPLNAHHVIGMHLLGRWVTGYGRKVAPPFGASHGRRKRYPRIQHLVIQPVAFVPASSQIGVLNSDGTNRVQRLGCQQNVTFVNVQQNIPTYQLVFPAAMQGVANVEYRIRFSDP